jgi:hypothetical protein
MYRNICKKKKGSSTFYSYHKHEHKVLHISHTNICSFVRQCNTLCYIDGQKNKYSVLNECSRMLKYNISHTNTPVSWAKTKDWV